MIQIVCNNCFQVERVKALPRDCGYCGSKDTKETKLDRYWFELCEHYSLGVGIAGAEFTYNLYQLWEPSEHRLFSDFVRAIKRVRGAS